MKQLLSFVRKETLHVMRDKKTLVMLVGLPIIQIVLFGFALTNEVKNSNVIVVDNAHDVASLQLIEKIDASKYFAVEKIVTDHNQIDIAFKKGLAKVAVVIPENFNYDLLHSNHVTVQIIADASNPNEATTMTGYMNTVIAAYQATLASNQPVLNRIVPEIKMLYNPELRGAPNFVPGVMALVLMLVCTMMTAVSIVKEKELGTMEILLVSPFKPIYIVISKAIPFLLVSIFNLCVILTLSVYLLELPIQGSIVLLVTASIVYIIVGLSIGLFISTTTDSQGSAMSISMLGMMLPTMLLSGYMFPLDNMPWFLRLLSNIVPSRWYFIIVKNVMIEGLGFKSVWKELVILIAMAVFLTIMSLKKFKIRLA